MITEVDSKAMFAAARDAVLAVLAVLPDAWAVYVYGSFARGEEWPKSDLDIAVLLPPEQRIPDVLQLMSNISQRVHRMSI